MDRDCGFGYGANLMAVRHDLCDWRERCDCGEVHDTYNGPSFPFSQCAGRECRTKICCECKQKCDECADAFCDSCVVAFEVNGKMHTMCFKCIVIAADEAEKEKEMAAA